MEKTTKYIDLSPLGKSRRILVFLADFFIAFILGLALFSLGCYPISKTFPSVKEANRIEREGQEEKRNLLFSSNHSHKCGLFFGKYNKNIVHRKIKRYFLYVCIRIECYVRFVLYIVQTLSHDFSDEPKKGEKKSYPTIFFQKGREFQKYHYICRQKLVPLCPVFIFFSFSG